MPTYLVVWVSTWQVESKKTNQKKKKKKKTKEEKNLGKRSAEKGKGGGSGGCFIQNALAASPRNYTFGSWARKSEFGTGGPSSDRLGAGVTVPG